MELNSGGADIYIPDGTELAAALDRTTHLGIGAHADDLEIMAWPGIAHCHGNTGAWFTGVVVTDGAGSPRSGPYANYSNAEMVQRRRLEQRNAAARGEYSAVLQLGYSSSGLKGAQAGLVTEDLLQIFRASRASAVYLHNLADSHSTHVATALAAIEALRRLPTAQQPSGLYGVEIWRGLDWLPRACRVELGCDPGNPLQGELLREFDSQISGGKRYDLAVAGRQAAHATFSQSHDTDRYSGLVLAMDLLPLLHDPGLTPGLFLQDQLSAFADDVLAAVGVFEQKGVFSG
jgi:LmbE family N-acetylglucosaminyl deacetylase